MSERSENKSGHPLDVHSKALALNLEPSEYGSIAEIGAGQGVAQWLLTVGGASGTVARTISAYDKKVSDETYGEGSRYVSKERLLAMLEVEYRLLLEHLGGEREVPTKFFAFANTVSARNFKGDNEQHGWVGIRFQDAPGAEASQVLLHVNMMDRTAALQQEAMGKLGINLIYGAHRQRGEMDLFLGGLFDGIEAGRLELDGLHLSGPAFAGQDERLWALRALEKGMGHVMVFEKAEGGGAKVGEPSGVLRKRPLVVERGLFERDEPFHGAMLAGGLAELAREKIESEKPALAVLELSMRPVTQASGVEAAAGASLSAEVVLERVNRMVAVGPVLVTDFAPTYTLMAYLRRHTSEPVRMVMGVSSLVRLMDERYYAGLAGALLEGLGKVLSSNVKVYVYPMPAEACAAALAANTGVAVRGDVKVIGLGDLEFKGAAAHLMNYLVAIGRMVGIA